MLRVIITTIFARGLHNQNILDQTRMFLSENRQSMVGIFKRYAKIGALGDTDMKGCLDDLVKSYMALIAAVDFLEVGFRPVSQYYKQIDAYSNTVRR